MWVKFRIMRQCRRPYCRLSPQRKRKLKTSSRSVTCKYGRRRWRLEKWHLLLCVPGSGDVELVRRKNWKLNFWKIKIRTHISIGIIYLFIFIFGIIGNGLVLYGFSKNRKLRQSISNSYMIHLAVTDLLFVSGFIFIFVFWLMIDFAKKKSIFSVSTLPFWAINQFKMTEWLFGLIACKLLRTISKVNMYG